MKHFIVTITLTACPAEIESHLVAEHDRHFCKGQDLMLFLFHGRLASGRGYLAVARTRTRETLSAFLLEDRLVAEGKASVQILEFEPAGFPEVLRGWMHPLGFGPGPEWDEEIGIAI